jgi:hypothetical protein
MRPSKSARALTLCLLIVIFCRVQAPVEAQRVDLAVAPPNIELLIKPGVRMRVPFTITNRSDEVSLIPLIKTFAILGDGKSVEYGSAEGLPIKASFYDEKSELIKSITIKNGEVKKIFVDLNVPSSISERDYSLAFIVETQPELLDKQYSARIKTQIASSILVTITKSGKTQAKGTIDVFKVARNIVDSFDSVPITLHVINQGKNVVYAGGAITVRGSLGEKVIYPLESHNILSHSGRLMVTKLSKDEFSIVLKGFFIGRYSVSAAVTLADDTVQLSRSTKFFAFPFKIISVAILGSLIGLILLRNKR